jgi:glucose/arabinose dehydrogenase
VRVIALVCFVALACSKFLTTGPPVSGTPTLQPITMTLSSPVFVTSPPGDLLRLFVVEQGGRVRVIRRDTLLATPFLNISGHIATAGSEQGLLSIAFHPQYATNGRFYVYFTNSAGDIRIVRYVVSSSDPNVADSLSGDTVLAVAHPGQQNHNGGQLQFGPPPDGKLYAGLGDGGGGGDLDTNAQNKHRLLGKLLRLDVDGATGYTIPADNPFFNDTSGAPEVWAYGLRNPWRFSFDRQTGDLYIADVGQNAYEEVDFAAAASGRGKGLNFGWNVMEGTHCYPFGNTCSQAGLTLPVVEYSHSDGCSITGGYVYRGTRVPALSGQYLYSDYCTHFMHSYKRSNGVGYDWTPQLDPGGNVSSFGEDARGELYVLTLGGRLYRIVEAP